MMFVSFQGMFSLCLIIHKITQQTQTPPHLSCSGTVNFTGDMPVILMVDGPSLGGFVCAATIVSTELWKVGQVRPNDNVHFRKISLEEAFAAIAVTDALVDAVASLAKGTATPAAAEAALSALAASARAAQPAMPATQPVLVQQEATATHPGLLIRLAGDRCGLLTCLLLVVVVVEILCVACRVVVVLCCCLHCGGGGGGCLVRQTVMQGQSITGVEDICTNACI
jgi:Carboxyltransferase domain, subdomain A and B